MNANILAILNSLGPQKSGKGIGTVNNKTSGSWQSADDTVAPLETTDNNGVRHPRAARKNFEANFNDALRKKMDAQNPPVHDEASKKEKDSSVHMKKSESSLQDVPCPPVTIHQDHPETGEVEFVNNKKSDKPDEILLNDSSNETPANNQKTGIVLSTKDTSVETENQHPTDIAVKSSGITADTSESDNISAEEAKKGNSDGIPSEKTPLSTLDEAKVLLKKPEQAGTTPILSRQTPGNNENAAVIVRQPASAGKPVIIDQRQTQLDATGKTHTFDTVNNNPQSPHADIAHTMEKSTVPPQKAPMVGNQSSQNAPKVTTASQSTDNQTETVTTQTSVQKMNITAEQIHISESEKQHHSSEQKNSNINSELTSQVSAETTASSTEIQMSSTGDAIEKMSSSTNQGHIIGRQVQESINHSYQPGTQQIVIRLDPPELGHVTIRFVQQQDGITGVLQVEKSQTHHQIQQTLPALVHNLQNSDIPIKKIEVVLNNQPQYHSGENTAGHNSQSGHQNAPDQQPFADSASYSEWSSNSQTATNTSPALVEQTDGSINLLI